jgi:polyisoprenoid-binding protein YceI
MKANTLLLHAAFICVLLLQVLSANAQQRYVIAPSSELKVEGTSTLRDWSMVSNQAKGQALISFENNKIQDIKNLVVTMPAKSLKSGSNQMDNHAYQSLNPKEHPEIRFELKSVEQVTATTLLARGVMTIAGVAKPMAVPVTYKVTSNGLEFAGQAPIKFSDFKIDAPTALMGTVKTGDNLNLSFNLAYIIQNL